MKVIYPVLFYEEKEGEYSVFVPDLENELNINASTCGDSLENAMEMAEDLIAGIVLDGMEDGNKIPKASKIQDINIEEFENYLYQNIPPIDLMIRTSGEIRISNFMLWQLAYAELHFTKTYFPALTKEEIDEILIEFSKRNRRFGKN